MLYNFCKVIQRNSLPGPSESSLMTRGNPVRYDIAPSKPYFLSPPHLVIPILFTLTMASPRTIPPISPPFTSGPLPKSRPTTFSRPGASPIADPQPGSSPSVPNIPPRASSSSPFATRALSGSFKPSSSSSLEGRNNQPSPKPSNDSLIGRKTSPAPQNTTSALTAQLGSSPNPHPPPPRKASRPNLDQDDSAVLTPKGSGHDSSFSNLADIPIEEKAKVLRRHLVSAEERRVSVTSPSNGNTPGGMPSPGDASPVGAHGDSGMQGGSSGSQEIEERDESQSFPIPYDAPGGDVT